MKKIKYEKDAVSNDRHKFPFVVQGQDSTLASHIWLDSKYGGRTLREAEEIAIEKFGHQDPKYFRIVKRNK